MKSEDKNKLVDLLATQAYISNTKSFYYFKSLLDDDKKSIPMGMKFEACELIDNGNYAIAAQGLISWALNKGKNPDQPGFSVLGSLLYPLLSTVGLDEQIFLVDILLNEKLIDLQFLKSDPKISQNPSLLRFLQVLPTNQPEIQPHSSDSSNESVMPVKELDLIGETVSNPPQSPGTEPPVPNGEPQSFEKALRVYKKYLADAESRNETIKVTQYSGEIANILFKDGNYEEAYKYYRKGVSHLRKTETSQDVRFARFELILGQLLEKAEQNNNYEKAIAFYQDKLNFCPSDQHLKRAETLLRLGELEELQKLTREDQWMTQLGYASSIQRYERCLELFEKLDNKDRVCYTLQRLAWAFKAQSVEKRHQNNIQEAYEYLQYSQEIIEKLWPLGINTPENADITELKAELYLQEGDKYHKEQRLADAVKAYQKSLEVANTINQKTYKIDLLQRLGDLALEQGLIDDADNYLEQKQGVEATSDIDAICGRSGPQLEKIQPILEDLTYPIYKLEVSEFKHQEQLMARQSVPFTLTLHNQGSLTWRRGRLISLSYDYEYRDKSGSGSGSGWSIEAMNPILPGDFYSTSSLKWRTPRVGEINLFLKESGAEDEILGGPFYLTVIDA